MSRERRPSAPFRRVRLVALLACAIAVSGWTANSAFLFASIAVLPCEIVGGIGDALTAGPQTFAVEAHSWPLILAATNAGGLSGRAAIGC